ncbi:MAG: hypothetical protein H7326_02505 [Bdellovibrionaceae bacterium]|nr:hypothetical protein [Pseudobdellovibrionaceae bacterium]
MAAPHPATSTSTLMDPQLGHYFQSQGFNLKTAGTDWLPTPQNNESIFESVRLTPKGLMESSASMSVRTDSLNKQATLESYAKKWMRDYPSYGFEVLGAKSFAMAGGPGLVVDMIQKSRSKQLRQVILQKGQRVAILTCLDNQSSFQKTLTACNQLVKNFEWNGANEATNTLKVAAPKLVPAAKAPPTLLK